MDSKKLLTLFVLSFANSHFGLLNAQCLAGSSQVPLSSTVTSNYNYPISQSLFFDDFGSSNINVNKGRKTSPYMASGGFIFGNSFANLPYNPGNCDDINDNFNQARINDGYYAVVAPGYIKKGWYYTANGASVNDCFTYWWTPADNEPNTVTDYSGTTNGAALVINAGNNLKPFYNRAGTLQVGAKYKASLQLYVITGNSPTRLAIDIIDAANNSVIATTVTPLYSTSQQNQWIPVSVEFTMPGNGEGSCVSRDVIVSYRNDNAAIFGNDYYIDNLKLEKTQDAASCPPAGGCVTSNINYVNLNSNFTGTPPSGTQLVWYTNPNHTGSPVSDPTHVTASGIYYAFFYDNTNNCYNTGNSTAAVTATIFPRCYCTQPGSSLSGGQPTKVGITTQNKLSAWPETILNGHIALESKTGGLVVTRVASSSSIAEPKKGMLIYDIAAACVKLYNGSVWKCIQKSCNE